MFRYFPASLGSLDMGASMTTPANVNKARVAVTFYSFFSCPFCPIVWQRLESLQNK